MEKNKSKKKLGLLVLTICLISMVAIGVSYAWWRFTAIQTEKNTAVSKCLKLELTNESDAISIANMYPISDEDGRKLTPYTFTLTNTCTVSAAYKLNMEMLEGTTLNSKHIAVMVNDGNINLLSSFDEATTVIDGSTESRTLDTGILSPNGSKDYSVSIWMDKSVTLEDDAQNKVFKSKIVVNATATKTTVDKIIAQLDTTGKCPTVKEDGYIENPGFEKSSGYLCSAPDAYGDSYYYRGTVDNNYVLFAGKYWRIVRINGDGSMRIIYDGTSAHANGESSADRHIGSTAFNDSNDDNRYVGYMYGDADGQMEDSSQYSTSNLTNTNTYYVSQEYSFNEDTKKFTLTNPVAILASDLTDAYVGYYTSLDTSTPSTYDMLYKITSVTTGDTQATVGYTRLYYGTTTKEQAQTNTNDSTIKKYLDSWYEENIKDTEYEQYLTDNLFCNDRSITSGTGAGKDKTFYRWSSKTKILLTCPQKNDAFTVSDTTNGNGSLKYPIGLLTADELWLAGGDDYYSTVTNSKFYLYFGSYGWLLSAYYFNGSTAGERFQRGTGPFSIGQVDLSYYAARPVLNLRSGLQLLGTGTMDDPYRIAS